MSDKAINNPAGAFGLTADTPYMGDSYKASATVTAAYVVAIGTDSSVAVAATNGSASLCIGIARDKIASGNVGLIITQGVIAGVGADGAISAGSVVKRSATTAGFVAATASPATGESLGVAIAASAANVVSVYVCKGT